MKKSKRAMLPQEVLKIILAVICIVLLFYLAVKLYGIFTVKTEMEQAKAVIEAISGKAGKLGEGEQTTYLVTNPKNWFLILTEQRTICNAPEGEKCLCLCGDVDYRDEINTFKKCKEEGICNSGKYILSSSCIKPGSYPPEQYFNCFSFENLPFNLIIKKSSNNVFLETSENIKTLPFFDELLSYTDKDKITLKEKFISLAKSESKYSEENIQTDINTFFQSKKIKSWYFKVFFTKSNSKNILFEYNGLDSGGYNAQYQEAFVYSFISEDMSFEIQMSDETSADMGGNYISPLLK